MNLNQKIRIGVFLIMNTQLIIIILIRVLSANQHTYDITQSLFFQYLKPNVAFLVTCFSAFRPLFFRHDSNDSPRPLYSVGKKVFRRTQPNQQLLDNLPSIPGPTLKGMRTVICMNNRTNLSNATINPIIAEDATDATYKQAHYRNIVLKHGQTLESAYALKDQDLRHPNSSQASSSHRQATEFIQIWYVMNLFDKMICHFSDEKNRIPI